jgi:hypothetical protein
LAAAPQFLMIHHIFGCQTAASFAEAFVAFLGRSVRAPCWNVVRPDLGFGCLAKVEIET